MADKEMTMAEAGAVAAILSAAERNAPVARLVPDIQFVMYAEARYVGGGDPDRRDIRTELITGILDLFLVVRLAPHPLVDARRLGAWPVRALISEYLAGTFLTDVTRDEPAVLVAESPAEQVLAARMWIADCFGDVEVSELSETQVRAGIERHYSGGWAQFVQDGPRPCLRRRQIAGTRGTGFGSANR